MSSHTILCRCLTSAILCALYAADAGAADAPPTIVAPAAASPATVTGKTSRLTVAGADDGGAASLTYAWSATGPAAVAFSATGTNAAKTVTATFTAPGDYVCTATVTDTSNQTAASGVTVHVVSTLSSLAISPASAVVNPGATKTFVATAKNQFGTVLVGEPFAWSATGAGTVDASGVFTAGATPGPATVTVGDGAKTASASIRVNAPPSVSLAAVADVVGTTVAVAATGSDPDDAATTLKYTWTATGPKAISVSPNGTNAAAASAITFHAAGAYVVTVTVKDPAGLAASASQALNVAATPTTVTVSPNSSSTVVNPGAAKAFAATAKDQFGAVITGPTVAWTVNPSSAGTITAAGLFTGGTPGQATVTAMVGAATSLGAPVRVNAPPTVVNAVATTAANPSTGTGAAFTVLGDDDGGQAQITYTWSATGPGGVSFVPRSGKGLGYTDSTATFTKVGSYTVTAMLKDLQGLSSTSTLPFTVQAAVTSASLNPASASLKVSANKTFAVQLRDQFGAVISGATVPQPVVWTVSGVGTITQAGVFSAGTVPGTATITAQIPTSPALTATAMVQVTTTQALPTPTITPIAGTYRAAFTAQAADTQSGVTFHYSLNGGADTPTATGQIPITQSGVLVVSATATGWQPSATTTVAYTLQVQEVTASVPGGVYTSPQQVILTTTTPDTRVTWSIDDGAPTTALAPATVPVTASGTLRAIASRDGWSDSPAFIAKYTILQLPQITDGPTGAPATVTGLGSTLSVGAKDPQGLTLNYLWTQSDGPAPVSLAHADAAITTASFTETGHYAFTVVVTNSAGQSSSAVLGVDVIAFPSYLTVSPGAIVAAANTDTTFTIAVQDQFHGAMTALPTWSVQGVGSITQGGVFSSGPTNGSANVTARLGSLSATASVQVTGGASGGGDGGSGGGGGGGGGNGTVLPTAPQVICKIVSGLTGDKEGDVNGEHAFLTKNDTIVLSVVPSGGDGDTMALRIVGGQNTVTSEAPGAFDVRLRNGRNAIHAEIDYTINGQSATGKSADVIIISDNVAPQIQSAKISPRFLDSDDNLRTLSGIVYLNGMSESDNHDARKNSYAQQFGAGDFDFQVDCSDDGTGMATNNGLVAHVEGIGGSNQLTGTLPTAAPGSVATATIAGFSGLAESAVADSSGAVTVQGGLYQVYVKLTDKCGNETEMPLIKIWKKTTPPSATLATMPYGGRVSSLSPFNGGELSLTALHWVLGDGDLASVTVGGSWFSLYSGSPYVFPSAGESQPRSVWLGTLGIPMDDTADATLSVSDIAGNKRDVTGGSLSAKLHTIGDPTKEQIGYEDGRRLWWPVYGEDFYWDAGDPDSQAQAKSRIQSWENALSDGSDEHRFINAGDTFAGIITDDSGVDHYWYSTYMMMDAHVKVLTLTHDPDTTDPGVVLSEMPLSGDSFYYKFGEYDDTSAMGVPGNGQALASFDVGSFVGPADKQAAWWNFNGGNYFEGSKVPSKESHGWSLGSLGGGLEYLSKLCYLWNPDGSYILYDRNWPGYVESQYKRFDGLQKEFFEHFGGDPGAGFRIAAPVVMRRPSWLASQGATRTVSWLVEATKSMSPGAQATITLLDSPLVLPLSNQGTDGAVTARAHGIAKATYDEDFPKLLEWQQQGSYQLHSKHTTGVWDHSDFRTPPSDQRQEIDDDSTVPDNYKWDASLPGFRYVGVQPDMVATGKDYSLTPAGQLLAVAFMRNGASITVPLDDFAALPQNDATADYLKDKIAIVDVKSHEVEITVEENADQQPDNPRKVKFQVVDSLKIRVGGQVDPGLVDLDVVLLPETLDIRYNGVHEWPDDMAHTYTGGGIGTVHSYPGSGSGEYGAQNIGHRLQGGFAVLGAAIHIDSDNNNGTDLPDESDAEARVADIPNDPAHPGKIILVDSADSDHDGIPDFVDGFSLYNDSAWASSVSRFVPIIIRVPDFASNLRLKLVYPASDPMESCPWRPAPGRLRIWGKNGDQARSGKNVADGGDYYGPGTYSVSDLKDKTLYVEAVRSSESVADDAIELWYDTLGNGQYELGSRVRLTARDIQIEGKCHLQTTFTAMPHLAVSDLSHWPGKVYHQYDVVSTTGLYFPDVYSNTIGAALAGDLIDQGSGNWQFTGNGTGLGGPSESCVVAVREDSGTGDGAIVFPPQARIPGSTFGVGFFAFDENPSYIALVLTGGEARLMRRSAIDDHGIVVATASCAVAATDTVSVSVQQYGTLIVGSVALNGVQIQVGQIDIGNQIVASKGVLYASGSDAAGSVTFSWPIITPGPPPPVIDNPDVRLTPYCLLRVRLADPRTIIAVSINGHRIPVHSDGLTWLSDEFLVKEPGSLVDGTFGGVILDQSPGDDEVIKPISAGE